MMAKRNRYVSYMQYKRRAAAEVRRLLRLQKILREFDAGKRKSFGTPREYEALIYRERDLIS
jgi:hypothetical protein